MPVPDLSRLSPADGAVTLRSLDRRFRAAVRPLDDPEVEAWAEIPGDGGRSALDHVAMAASTLALLRASLHQIVTQDDPALETAVLDPDRRSWDESPAALELELDRLRDVAMAFADDVDGLAAEAWKRQAHTADAAPVDAGAVLAEAVRSALVQLDGATAAMTAARQG